MGSHSEDSGSRQSRLHCDVVSRAFTRHLCNPLVIYWILELGREAHDSTKWLAKKFGDVYLHETAIAHIRRLLGTQFVCGALHESPSQFKQRMRKVEDFMNSDDFAAANGGRGLLGLAKDLHKRCEAVIQLKGERIPK